MTDEPEPTPDTESWGSQDGFTVESDGQAREWYKDGSEEVYGYAGGYKLDATYVFGEALEVVMGTCTNFVFGGEVNFVAPLDVGIKLGLSLEMELGGKVEWSPDRFHLHVHGPHALCKTPTAVQCTQLEPTYLSNGGYYHLVDGESTWQVIGESTWKTIGPMTLSAAEKLSCSGLSVAVAAETKCSIGGAQVRISGDTNTLVFGAESFLLLNTSEAALENATGGGIKATAAQTVISGTKVMIGIPGGPPPAPIATQTQIAHLDSHVNTIGSKVTKLEQELKTLRENCKPKLIQQGRFVAGSLRK
ncbi:MAG: hypothetical protein ACKO35_09550 [Planctomycetaceae bacterium]